MNCYGIHHLHPTTLCWKVVRNHVKNRKKPAVQPLLEHGIWLQQGTRGTAPSLGNPEQMNERQWHHWIKEHIKYLSWKEFTRSRGWYHRTGWLVVIYHFVNLRIKPFPCLWGGARDDIKSIMTPTIVTEAYVICSPGSGKGIMNQEGHC